MLGDGKAKPSAAAFSRFISFIKAVTNIRKFFSEDTLALILNRYSTRFLEV
ncbi:hypothetical protein UNSWDHB_470 [Dehalobacter sp. UNSWDHB]|nr:hypothetical protein UNSWDHB_470 [Dehalobacter sp. UNSWDHB]